MDEKTLVEIEALAKMAAELEQVARAEIPGGDAQRDGVGTGFRLSAQRVRERGDALRTGQGWGEYANTTDYFDRPDAWSRD